MIFVLFEKMLFQISKIFFDFLKKIFFGETIDFETIKSGIEGIKMNNKS